MPELPEVETIVRELIACKLENKKITKAYVYWPRIVDTSSSEDFVKKIQNQSIEKIERRGKYLVFTLNDYTLLVHLRMTGKFQFITKENAVDKHEHVRLIFNDGTVLRYEDPRKFGRWSLYQDATEKMSQLGLEPLSAAFTMQAFKNLLRKHSSQIKPFLLNQKHIAGLGNIYVDEALWEAKIHPLRATNSLSDNDIKNLHKAIQKVLNSGIDNLGTSLGNGKGNYFNVSGQRGGHQHHLNVFAQDGKTCARCGKLIMKTVVAQRGTHFCPQCQKMES
jgi:formamidopyrimidine-DNA glycosylase